MSASISPDTLRAWADIDLGAVVANARTVAESSGSRLLPMVKADAYGLGAVRITRVLERVNPWGYGVATVDEGREVRAAGITRPIVVFTPLLPAAADQYLAHNLRPAIGDLEALRAWLQKSGRPFHLEIDTGMARSGVRWDDTEALTSLATDLQATPGWEGLFTHFHSADDDPATAEEQWNRFKMVVNAAGPPAGAGSRGEQRGGAAGPALFAGTWCGPGFPVRRRGRRTLPRGRGPTAGPGGGGTPGAPWRYRELRSHLDGRNRPTTIATLSVGYADGLLRALSGKGRVELNGRIVPIVGPGDHGHGHGLCGRRPGEAGGCGDDFRGPGLP